jgi:hypothetical protein
MSGRLCGNTLTGRHTTCTEPVAAGQRCRRCEWQENGWCWGCGERRESQDPRKLLCDACASASLRQSNDRSRHQRKVARRAYDRARYMTRKGENA